ncbi:hypothetical protein CCR94_10830 [Rhodoblastus sphagnicola]|uniref:Uncharacterized protein n=1 Tax=Rhodoblastus sphagnicola TaxID=333368 RepID=A0A2S6N8Q0_9HYPH|nr:hypothetical protein [Rhodoblastus sphagnicola]MBB4199947.1 hypothetical protein [Rhodoblastus sphagnicola]PPQ30967.1 hypothetical protein CCR94_10830 [Rhodoblastus sphagnicola]
MDGDYQFRIADNFTPATIPMGRLADSMAALADLLGEAEQVHFTAIEAGSVRLKAHVDPPARLKVRDRIRRIFGPALRFHDEGTWVRHGDGAWELRHFKIKNFEELEDRPLSQVVASPRKVKGSAWPEVPDPVRSLLEDRYGNEDANLS